MGSAVYSCQAPEFPARRRENVRGKAERFVGVVWFLRIFSGYGDLRIVKKFYWHRSVRQLSVCNQQHQTDLGRNGGGDGSASSIGLEVEVKGLLKNLIIIFIF
jgi:hypothetical protein